MVKLGSKEHEQFENMMDKMADDLWEQYCIVENCYELLYEHIGILVSTGYEDINNYIVFGLDGGKRFRKAYESFRSMWLECNEFLENFRGTYEIEEDDMITEGLSCLLQDIKYEFYFWGNINDDAEHTIVKDIKEDVQFAFKCWEIAVDMIEEKCNIAVDYGLFEGIDFISPKDDCGNIVKDNVLGYYDATKKEIFVTKRAVLKCNEDELVRTLCHEIAHSICHKYFKDNNAYKDNSVVFATLVNFMNKRLHLSIIEDDISVNITQNYNYAYMFRTQHHDLWKIAVDGRKSWRTIKEHIRNYMKDNEDLRIVSED